MGTSFSDWDNVTAYFVFANQPTVLFLFVVLVAAVCIFLVVSIKKHEDQAFAEYVKKGDNKQKQSS